MEAIIALLIQSAVPIAASAITMLVAYLGKKAAEYTAQKTKNEAVNNALAHITNTAETIVRDIEQTVVPYYIRNAEGGKLDKAERDAVKKMALDRLRKQVPDSIKALAGIAINSIEDLMSAKVEVAVQKMNAEKK